MGSAGARACRRRYLYYGDLVHESYLHEKGPIKQDSQLSEIYANDVS